MLKTKMDIHSTLASSLIDMLFTQCLVCIACARRYYTSWLGLYLSSSKHWFPPQWASLWLWQIQNHKCLLNSATHPTLFLHSPPWWKYGTQCLPWCRFKMVRIHKNVLADISCSFPRRVWLPLASSCHNIFLCMTVSPGWIISLLVSIGMGLHQLPIYLWGLHQWLCWRRKLGQQADQWSQERCNAIIQ